MTTNGARAETKNGFGTNGDHSNQAPLPPFNRSDDYLARHWRPGLYCQIKQEYVSFDHIAKAWWIRNDPAHPAGEEERRVSLFLEHLAREKFSEEHDSIKKDYWSDKPWAGCALTGDGWVHSVMNINDRDLAHYESRVHQLCRDAHRAFEVAAPRNKKARTKKAEKDLTEVGICSIASSPV